MRGIAPVAIALLLAAAGAALAAPFWGAKEPRPFRAKVQPLLVPGTSLVVTDASILEHPTGVAMTVLTSHPEG